MTDRVNKRVIAESLGSCNSVKSFYDSSAVYSSKMIQIGSDMIKRILGFALLIGMFAFPTQAAVMVTVRSTSMTEGMPATIDVFVRAELGTTVDLDNFGLEFLISPGSPRQIQFAPTQDFPGLTTATNYVFFDVGGNPFGSIAPTNFLNDTFVGGDFAGTGPASVPNSDVLLTRLKLLPGTALAGDVFTVSLVNIYDASTNPSGNTFFDDGSFTKGISVVFAPGTVTIVAANAAVPEPSSAATLMAIAVIGAWSRRRQSRLLWPSVDTLDVG